MRVLDRYIVKAICSSGLLVLAVLATLLVLFLFINEQGWVGVGRYGNLQALRYTLLNLPSALVPFLPVVGLIGSLQAMGSLSLGSELVILRAAGLPIWRIAGSVLLAGLFMVPVAIGVGEYLAPPLAQMARMDKAALRNTNISFTGGNSAWIRDGGQILRADRLPGETGLGGITQFELAPDNTLVSVGQAPVARATPAGGWELRDYAQTRFEAQRVASGVLVAKPLDTSASPAFLTAMASDPMELSWSELGIAMAHLKSNGQDVRHFQFAYWSKVSGLLAIPLAMLLAVPFVFGPLGRAESGARATLGLVIGLVYFMLQRMVESGTLAFSLNPVLLAFLPAALLAAAVALLLRAYGRG